MPVLPRYFVKGGLMWSERKHGLATEQFPVSPFAGSSKNLQNLKDPNTGGRCAFSPRFPPTGLKEERGSSAGASFAEGGTRSIEDANSSRSRMQTPQQNKIRGHWLRGRDIFPPPCLSPSAPPSFSSTLSLNQPREQGGRGLFSPGNLREVGANLINICSSKTPHSCEYLLS